MGGGALQVVGGSKAATVRGRALSTALIPEHVGLELCMSVGKDGGSCLVGGASSHALRP